MSEIKAIETRFRGYRFRSRLEARWAVFFESLQIPWQYEMEGFDLPSQKYLPDFWLPRQKMWVEIKPSNFSEPTMHLTELATATDSRVYLLEGSIPGLKNGLLNNEKGSEFGTMFFPNRMSDPEWIQDLDGSYFFCRCANCGEYGVEYLGRSERIECCQVKRGCQYISGEQSIINAYIAARSRRFEYDEAEQWD